MFQPLKEQLELLPSEGYILTYTGKRFYPTRPEDLEVDIIDIAHALSNVCRYNGHLRTFYSVAQHSCLVAREVEEKYGRSIVLSALLHDASEAYLPDMPSPIKDILPDFKALEERLHRHIFKSFGLSWPYPKVIKGIDKTIREDEMRDLSDWELGGEGIGVIVQAWEPSIAKSMFLDYYNDYNGGG